MPNTTIKVGDKINVLDRAGREKRIKGTKAYEVTKTHQDIRGRTWYHILCDDGFPAELGELQIKKAGK